MWWLVQVQQKKKKRKNVLKRKVHNWIGEWMWNQSIIMRAHEEKLRGGDCSSEGNSQVFFVRVSQSERVEGGKSIRKIFWYGTAGLGLVVLLCCCFFLFVFSPLLPPRPPPPPPLRLVLLTNIQEKKKERRKKSFWEGKWNGQKISGATVVWHCKPFTHSLTLFYWLKVTNSLFWAFYL